MNKYSIDYQYDCGCVVEVLMSGDEDEPYRIWDITNKRFCNEHEPSTLMTVEELLDNLDGDGLIIVDKAEIERRLRWIGQKPMTMKWIVVEECF